MRFKSPASTRCREVDARRVPATLMKNKIINVFLWIFLIAEGLVFTFLLPPFQKYDETGHFNRAVALSSGQIFCKNSQFLIPKDLANLYAKYNFLAVLVENKTFPINLINFNEKRDISKSELASVTPCNFSFVGYLPNVMGIWVGELSGQVAVIFYGGRICGFIFFALMLAISLKTIKPKFRYLLWFYALTPLVVHTVTAFSYDVTILSLVPILVALFVNKLEGQNWTGKNWMVIWLILAIISAIKIVYLPLVLLFLVLDFKRIKINGLILILVAITVLGVTKILAKEIIYNQYVNPTIQQKLILNDPVFFVSTTVKTMSSNWLDEYKSMVAVFGWKNANMSNELGFYAYFAGLIWMIKETEKRLAKKMDWRLTIFGLLINVGIVGYIYLAMYLTWSVVASSYVYGTQGRYYLPILPFVLILLAQLWGYLKNKSYLLIGLIMILVLASCGKGLYDKYFDYSKDYVDKKVILNKKDKVDFILINKKTDFVVETNSENIFGFKINIDNRNKAILIPYRYRVMDKSCQKTLKYGYFRQYEIQNDNVYTEKFGTLNAKDKQLCFELEPLTFNLPGYMDSFLWVKTRNDKLVFEWLYF